MIVENDFFKQLEHIDQLCETITKDREFSLDIRHAALEASIGVEKLLLAFTKDIIDRSKKQELYKSVEE